MKFPVVLGVCSTSKITRTRLEIEILARNLDDTVLDYGLELYGLHNLPLLSEQGSGSIAAHGAV